ncbi:putative hydrolase or acyltransferase of alpha/beta superfamily [Saccharomonospora marina XMU15]|uniref:Putative hydrolase or acyltransferase of alpha/beta superfamily n=1 Tax=Saccharomonospora marina XMU15 TaxID=882083 RepID=H5X2K0_9PSEU|nr:alpha/beta fold hydrolase [Saccharomonospora marina]EHR49865.1 putative hydrolase or acyltransferase of alpha/beta superfamily [Saccharomonospora marina XMU15]
MREFGYRGRDGCRLFATTVGEGPAVVLLHGGGPDHHSLLPLAHELAAAHTVVLPDVRGYGRSHCADPARHTWSSYAEDVVALLDQLGLDQAAVGGTGLGATITLRAALEHPDRVSAAILVSVEDIEDDAAKAEEIAFMDAFAERVRTQGVEAAWAPILPGLAPIIGTLVRDAIPRSDQDSVAAAAAIGRDRAFRDVAELAPITAPTLVFPGIDRRHPAALAERVAQVLPDARLVPDAFSADLRTADDLAAALGPEIRRFLAQIDHGCRRGC